MRKSAVLLCTFFLWFTTLSAQKHDLSEISTITMENIVAIKDGDVIKGYFTFFFVDRKNKKENIYQLQILDNNLKLTHQIELIEVADFEFIDVTFNNKSFCFSFFSLRNKSLKYMIYNLEGEPTGIYEVKDLNDSEINYYSTKVSAESQTYYPNDIVSVPEKGFLRYVPYGDKDTGPHIEFIDNDAKLIWSSEPKDDSKATGSLMPFLLSGNIVISSSSSIATGIPAKNSYFLLHSIEDGSEIKRIELSEFEEKGLMPLNAYYDPAVNELIFVGEYYPVNTKGVVMLNEGRAGFFAIKTDAKGEIIMEKYISWNSEVAPHLPRDENGKAESNKYISIHNLVKTASGKYYIIGEMYQKSFREVELLDMILFEFSSDFNLEEIHFVPKGRTTVPLPDGMVMVSTHMLYLVLKTLDQFDYSYVSQTGDLKSFSVVYVKYEKNKSSGSNYYVGTINYTNDQLIKDKLEISSNSTWFTVLPAKPGYIAIFEYFQKEKRGQFRLEKMDI